MPHTAPGLKLPASPPPTHVFWASLLLWTTVQLLTDTEQKVQLAAFEMQRTAKGAVTYNAAKGYHDDIIMADAFALHGMRTAQYAVR